MKEVILIKNGELALKGLNRNTFEDTLMRNIRKKISDCGKFRVYKSQSTIYVEPEDGNCDIEDAAEKIGKTFGIAAYSRCAVCEKDMATILKCTSEYLSDSFSSVKTFKVESKRADKRFPLKSPEICAEVGEKLLNDFPNLTVDVHNPDLIVNVEIRDYGAYIHSKQIHGAGGLPVGTSGKAAILISGGIDSPVAAYTIAKRGVLLEAIHFASPPYTSPQAEEKVKMLLGKVAEYSGDIFLQIVLFTEIQEQIADKCPEEYFTLIMRRMMMRIAALLAHNNRCGALITGESLGQVASQTLPAIAVTDAVSELPVLRPLIGMDKEEIIKISRAIDTFDISILPYEDCCTVFTPKHPKTRPVLSAVEEAEKILNIDKLIENAIAGIRKENIHSR